MGRTEPVVCNRPDEGHHQGDWLARANCGDLGGGYQLVGYSQRSEEVEHPYEIIFAGSCSLARLTLQRPLGVARKEPDQIPLQVFVQSAMSRLLELRSLRRDDLRR